MGRPSSYTKEMGNFPPYKEANVCDLLPYANNARTHSDAQVAQIAASIKEFGFTNPVLVDVENPSTLGGVTPTHALQHREDHVPQPA